MCHSAGSGAALSYLMAVRLTASESFSLYSAFFNSVSLKGLTGVTVKPRRNSCSGRDFYGSFESVTLDLPERCKQHFPKVQTEKSPD
mgnify:CR=1 FL=1